MSNINKVKKRFVIVPSSNLLKGEKGEKGDSGNSELLLPLASSDIIHQGNLLSDILNTLLYIPISITSFTTTQTLFEFGTVLTSIPLSWNLNKIPTSQSLFSVFSPLITPANDIRNLNLTLNNANTNFTIQLTAGDDVNTVVRTVTCNFVSPVYTGKSTIPTSINPSFLISLNKRLSNNKNVTFIENPSSNEYIWIALPLANGIPSFRINGFLASMLLTATILHTNSAGGIEDYLVYRTDFSNLGTTEIEVFY